MLLSSAVNSNYILIIWNVTIPKGDWVDDKRRGHGVHYFASGDRYDGDWVDNKRHGHGVYYHANGDRYDGD